MNRKFAMVFPGQGSQTIGMLNDMAEKFPVVKQTFSQASKILGYDLWQLASQGPKEKLDKTEFTQPVMLAADIALWRCWLELKGAIPEVAAGHSLGEYSALVCAESLAYEDAISLVALRGKVMQDAVPEGKGSMGAIIGLSDDVVRQICSEASQGDILSPANFNSLGQVVIAGSTAAVNRAVAIAKTKNAKTAAILPVSIPSHCPMMKPAAEQMKVALEKVRFNPPKFTVLHNYDVKSHTDPESIRRILVEQIVNPVRWVEIIQEMENMGVTEIIECGPGKVLQGTIKWISRTIKAYSINSPKLIEESVQLISSNR